MLAFISSTLQKQLLKRKKEKRYRGQAVLRSYTVIFHTMSWRCVNQPCSFRHGHMIGREKRRFPLGN